MLKRILLWIAASVGVLIGLVLILAVTIWLFPGIVVRTAVLERFLNSLKSDGVEFTWAQLEVDGRTRGFFTKEIEARAARLCVKSPVAKGCATNVRALVAVHFEGWRFALSVDALTGDGEYLNIAIADTPAKDDPSDESGLLPEMPGFFSYFKVGEVNFPFANFNFLVDGFAAAGQAHIGSEAMASRLLAKVQGDFLISERRFQGAVHGKLPTGVRSPVLAVSAELKDPTVVASLQGELAPGKAYVDLKGSVKKLAKELPNLHIEPCRLEARGGEKNKALTLTADCHAQANTFLPAFRRSTHLAFDQTKAQLKAQVKINPNKTLSGSFEVAANPIFDSFKDGEAALVSDVSGSLRGFPSELTIKSNLNLKVNRFQRLVKLLSRTSYAIPSPFNDMEGTVALQVKGDGNLKSLNADFPVNLAIQLASPKQVATINADGTVYLRSAEKRTNIQLNAQVNIADLQLLLPDFKSTVPPQMFPDGRIKGTLRAPAGSGSKVSFTYDINIKSAPEKPIRLLARLAKETIPLQLEIHALSNEGVNGQVRVLPFSLELFRRTATVEKMNLSLTDDSRDTTVDGVIKVVYADYTIRVLILGLVAKPQIHFVSEPPLPEDKALAVLLFGKTLDALDEEQAASVGGTRSALADGAVSLASMYILASTPVESVGYDPVTRIFTARVRVADGTTLSVGSNMKAVNEIGIRKRLGGHWTIATYLENPFDPLERTLTAFLEWSKGY